MSSFDFQTSVFNLRRLSHELLYLGSDGLPIYSDYFTRLNREIFRLANELYDLRGASTGEEAELCLALLMGYNATIYDDGDKNKKIQCILDRSWKLLPVISDELLKVQLLTYCYGEIFDEELAREAKIIIAKWADRKLTEEEREIVEELRNLEENQYPNWEINE